MSKYVLAFRGPSDRKATAEQEAAWGNWFQELGSTVVDFGSRVGQVSALGEVGAGAGNGRNVLTGYVLIEAKDLEAAVAVAKGCPGLSYGGGVEVGETVAM